MDAGLIAAIALEVGALVLAVAIARTGKKNPRHRNLALHPGRKA